MSTLFISHSSQDDGLVRELQQALGDLNRTGWRLGIRALGSAPEIRSRRRRASE
jgi:hypothetical protein